MSKRAKSKACKVLHSDGRRVIRRVRREEAEQLVASGYLTREYDQATGAQIGYRNISPARYARAAQDRTANG